MSSVPPKTDFIPLSVPVLRGREWEYVKECLDTGWVSSAGSFVNRFEKEFASYVGSRHAIACASGSAALHVSLLLAGVKAGDEVLVPSLTFIASVNAIRYCGAEPVFFGCDEFYNLDGAALFSFLESETERREAGLFNRRTGRRIAALLPVHVFGNAVALPDWLARCRELGLPVVEDAAESLGTRYHSSHGGRHTGALGLLGAFSFNGNKIMTTGGGGMIVTDSDELARKARYLTTQAKDDEVRFVHEEVGYNYRMTNVQAAMGLAQLEQMPAFLRRKREVYEAYREGLAGVSSLEIGPVPAYATNNHWMPCLQIAASYGEDREALMARLQSAAIQTRPVWLPNHRQTPYRACHRVSVESADALWEKTLNLPCSTDLSDAQIERVLKELRRG